MPMYGGPPNCAKKGWFVIFAHSSSKIRLGHLTGG